MKPINILVTDETIELGIGTYSLYVLGGFLVQTNGFEVVLREVYGKEEIRPKQLKLRPQEFLHGRFAKMIATFDVLKRSEYQVEFVNASELKVKRLNFPLKHSFLHHLPMNQIDVVFEKR